MGEIGTNGTDSSFYLTLWSGDCRGTCMVLDEHAWPLTRSWCLFELIETMLLEDAPPRTGAVDFKGLLFCTSTGVLNSGKASLDISLGIGRRLATLRLQDATASDEADRVMINEIVQTRMGGFKLLNTRLRMEVLKALGEAKMSSESEFHSLAEMLKKTKERTQSALRLVEEDTADMACNLSLVAEVSSASCRQPARNFSL